MIQVSFQHSTFNQVHEKNNKKICISTYPDFINNKLANKIFPPTLSLFHAYEKE